MVFLPADVPRMAVDKSTTGSASFEESDESFLEDFEDFFFFFFFGFSSGTSVFTTATKICEFTPKDPNFLPFTSYIVHDEQPGISNSSLIQKWYCESNGFTA